MQCVYHLFIVLFLYRFKKWNRRMTIFKRKGNKIIIKNNQFDLKSFRNLVGGRRTSNFLILLFFQSASMAFDKVTEDNVYICVGHPLRKDIDNIIRWLLNTNFNEAYNSILLHLYVQCNRTLITMINHSVRSIVQECVYNICPFYKNLF